MHSERNACITGNVPHNAINLMTDTVVTPTLFADTPYKNDY
jgi:hypothetical protein